jgi:hypothetical protein
LEVKRHTITNRLRLSEERIGCALEGCAAGLEVALGLGEADLPAPTANMAAL